MHAASKSLLTLGLIAGAIALGAPAAKAMPLGLDPAIATEADTALKAENVRWVCGPFACRWVPNYYAFGPRPYWGPRWGWGHGWRGRHRW